MTKRAIGIAHDAKAAIGLGPLMGILVSLAPFAFERTILSMTEAAICSVGFGIGILGVFGAYMGSVSGQRWYVAAIRMALAGLVVGVITIVLPG